MNKRVEEWIDDNQLLVNLIQSRNYNLTISYDYDNNIIILDDVNPDVHLEIEPTYANIKFIEKEYISVDKIDGYVPIEQ